MPPGVRGASVDQGASAEEIRTPGLDRMLWLFLRLLVSRAALDRFLQTTNEQEIAARLAELRNAYAAAQARADRDERIVRSLQDSIAGGELRLDNYGRAKKNAEFVSIELDRIEGKIQTLAEMVVNRQDPDFLSSQVDSAADSMRQTEKAVSELQHLTGLADQLEEPPAILESDLRQVLRPGNRGNPCRLTSPPAAPSCPDGFRRWAVQLADLYFSGTTAAFVLHGNTDDVFRITGEQPPHYGVLAEFLAEQIFGRWSLVLHYDMGRGPAGVRRTRRQAPQGDGGARQQEGRRLERAVEGSGHGVRRARSVRSQQHHGRGRRSRQRGRDHGPGVVHVSVRRARPPQPAGVIGAGDDAQLGDEPACQTAEHGVRAGG